MLLILVAGFGFCVSVALFLLGLRRTALAVWTLTIVSVSFPFESFVTHAHWDKIGWIPFYSWPVRLSDIIANVLLYMPLGFFAGAKSTTTRASATKAQKHRGPSRWIGVSAFVLSLALETSQDFSHSRFPSATDLVCNVTGALVGAALAERLGL